MAKSKAQKHRDHAIRNGNLKASIVDSTRGAQPDFSTHTRRTPSKAERLRKSERKHKSFINL